ncbi:MAG: GAF domain-containing protein, partial [Chloroflexota bacterium]
MRIILTSRQPMWLGWGDDLTFLYNDPYRSIVGNKHPNVLGQPTAVVWREIWPEIAPRIQSALGGDLGTYDEAFLLIMERRGYPEETYYTFSYSPIPGDDGRVAGIFCATSDDTRRVIGERRLRLLQDLAVGTSEARTVADTCALSLRRMETNPRDVPFALLYLVEPDHDRAILIGTANLTPGRPAAPEVITFGEPAAWPVESVVLGMEPCLISDLEAVFGAVPAGAWDRSPTQAVALPIAPSGRIGVAGVLIVGLNPYRPFDDDYRRFMGLVADEIALGIARAWADEERARLLIQEQAARGEAEAARHRV